MKKNDETLRIISLGGLGEIGKNITAIEYGEDIILIDCGLGFPDDDMLGVDLVIPDFTYLEKKQENIRGLFLTHGHEDHIGGVPYLLKELDVPVYGTRLTLGILDNKLAEHRLDTIADLHCVKAGDVVKAGVFSVEFIRVNHSIADACCLAVKTPYGTVVHSGDFKLDLTPVESEMMDLTRLGEIGKKGVLALLCESTNVEHPGYTMSERTVGNSLDGIFMKNPDKRLIITTFSSNVHRVQQIINTSVKYGRKVAITGRSMLNIVGAAIELGYINAPQGSIIDINELKRYPAEQITIVTTGSQGEPMSALYRIAFSDHEKVQLGPKDLVVISANPIPGNEKLVGKIINELFRKGASVFRDSTVEVHVSGHACQEELKLMHALTKPKYFMPVHGEYRHLIQHRELAKTMGMPEKNIFVSEIGKVLEIDRKGARFNGTVPSGRVLVDGYGVGDVGNIVLRDRKHLSQDGLIVVVATIDSDERLLLSGPDIVSRGFVYMREAEELMDEVKAIAADTINECLDNAITDRAQMKSMLKDDLTKFLYSRTKKKPMILPVVTGV
ncbi:MAG: ribonuclease J [Ruminococcaceae bacterium]|nr:ribonuclease J [Oscillospiraceae bacterium]